MSFSGGRWGGRPPMAPSEFSARVAILGMLALVAFAVIFFRLWYLQVLSGDRYLQEAQNNRVRDVTVQAPRGNIRDRKGNLLVGNRTALALQLHMDDLPSAAPRRKLELKRLAAVAGMDVKQVRKRIRTQMRDGPPGQPITLRRDVSFDVVYFLRENQDRFPGVTVDRVYVRRYPQGTTGAHVFGYVREVNAEQLGESRYNDLAPGDNLGQDGVELTYDSLLRGQNGETKVKVDAAGQPTGGQASVREPHPGNDLLLTIDDKVQQAGEAALSSRGLPGAFVAMKVSDGEVLGLGSNPTFAPASLAKPSISPATSKAIFGDPGDSASTGAPAFDRALAGAYPTGSSFKPITALAALDGGFLTPGETINDTGSIKLGDQEFKNSGDKVNGPIKLEDALKVSSDVFFYNMGIRAEDAGGEPIQNWAENLGLGATTGIDLPGEGSGLIPTPEWRNDLYKKGLTDRPWTVGDNINLAVGQGDVQADPLQMAVAYAAIANGGTVVRPHVALRAEDPAGRVVQEIDPQPRRHVDIDPNSRQVVLAGLHDAAMSPGGTSYPVFGGFPVEVAGKTGTAERPPHGDQAWYVAVAPYDNPKIVVAVTIEEGGFGVDSAAPAAREILTSYFHVRPGQVNPVSASGGYE